MLDWPNTIAAFEAARQRAFRPLWEGRHRHHARREVAAISELTASTREAAWRVGVSDTALRKAEQTNRMAREHDGSWDIDKTLCHLEETADGPRRTYPGNAERQLALDRCGRPSGMGAQMDAFVPWPPSATTAAP
jgi:hypothetical protein